MLGNKLLRILFVLLYSLYLMTAVNTKLNVKVIPYGNFYVFIYLFAIIVLLFAFKYKPLSFRKKDISFRTVFLFTIYILLFGIITFVGENRSSLFQEMLAFIKYIFVVSVTVYFVKCFNMFSDLLIASFIGGSALLLYEFVLAGLPFGVFSRLGTFFSNDYTVRYRLGFNFNNFNTVGNISACSIIVYILLISWLRNTRKRSLRRLIVFWVCTFIAGIDLVVLLSSGSRNSMITLLIFFAAILYYYVTEYKGISFHQQNSLKAVVITFGILISCVLFFVFAFEMFVTSGRLSSFEINIPLVVKNYKLLGGLGIMHPGLFGRKGMGFIVDNYYLYVFLETGIVGLIIIGVLLFRMSKGIQHLRMSGNPFYIFLSSAFLAWVISGIGEACVLYPSFVSSMVFFNIFLAAITEGSSNPAKIK